MTDSRIAELYPANYRAREIKEIAGWLAAILVGLVYVAVAAFLGLRGREQIKRATPPVPEQTVDTVKEDVEWAKTRARSAQR